MVQVHWFDKVAYYVRYLAIYVLFIGLFLPAGIGKLFGGESVPSSLFEKSWLDGTVVLSTGWTLDGIGELVVALLMIASLVTGEWFQGRTKQLLRIGLAVATLLFGVMCTGMTIADQTASAASLFFYFGATSVVYLVVRHDEREAEGKEAATGV
ncbi:hypothetical protein [Serinibacter salmoneus]|uniref:DoxX-like protein n=1 Tax=Serinibacter salmoneus TaxID=556530 RepID=A0A2A9D0J9_9MICO|nr:hypothetical protein [Serinibacter salmoneus]PFG20228.1 hypothetical protein ATL40_1823 [Serinibacter salmoneus]